MASRKKLDIRLKTLIENGIVANHRSIFVIVGDKGRDQIPILFQIMTKSRVQANPEVLWAYKKDLGFSSNRKKRMKQTARKQKYVMKDIDDDDIFEVFISTTKIRYCYYKESEKILGQTFGMCIIQDFEGVTPNLLARTIETVSGGGLVIILLRSLKSLKQLYTMTMDVHSRYRTESRQDVVGRFNERFILSLGNCHNCLVIDDQLNILPISSSSVNLKPLPPKTEEMKLTEEEMELKEMTFDLMSQVETALAGSLVACCATLDQGKAVLKMIDAVVEKSLQSTVVMTAGRGRGKSAALGLGMAAAVAFGYSNIFVTSPSPENLKTLFEYIGKGLTALKYEAHLDYEMVHSTDPDFNKACVRVNIFKDHRQTIQYISPEDHQMLAQAELLCIDEAAAIPLMHVTKLLGPYLVFMSSTVNGYEGTGRSLSLKLISDLRETSSSHEVGVDAKKISQKLKEKTSNKAVSTSASRSLYEIELLAPIRYGNDDPVEQWLTSLLCLNIKGAVKENKGVSKPPPQSCELYYVNRDTLFSFHKKTEEFLQKLVSIFVASHYKNSPNDLQMMSDAPAHHIFCLLGPSAKSSHDPEILCAIQVALEGEISKETIMRSLKSGVRGDGDMIPWMVEQEFGEREFAKKSGARIVRIAASPEHQRMGYGKRAIQLLQEYFEGKMVDASVEFVDDSRMTAPVSEDPTVSLLEEQVKPKEKLPPLLIELNKRRPEKLDYIGVSYGITYPLLMFWKKLGMVPVYVAQQKNILTGENNCIMLKILNDQIDEDDNDFNVGDDGGDDDDHKKNKVTWLSEFFEDFRRRFISLLPSDFRDWKSSMALAVLLNKNVKLAEKYISKEEINYFFTPFDLDRLDKYVMRLANFGQIRDLLPKLSTIFFERRLNVILNINFSAVLLAVGLQCKSVEAVSLELDPKDKTYKSSRVENDIRECVRVFNDGLRLILNEGENPQKMVENDEVEDDDDKEEAEDKLNAIAQQFKDEMCKAEELGKKQNSEAFGKFSVAKLKSFEVDSNNDAWSKEIQKKMSSGNRKLKRPGGDLDDNRRKRSKGEGHHKKNKHQKKSFSKK